MKKTLSIIAASAMLLNSLIAPLSVLAQTIEPTPTAESTPAPEATIAPTEEPLSTPTETPVDLTTPTPEVSPTSEETPTPVPTDQPTETQAPESIPTTPGPPEEPSESGQISAIIYENQKLDISPINDFDLEYKEDGSATISTDKLDYSPTDTAVISGTGFTAGKTYTIYVTSSDKPEINFSDSLTANDKGEVLYSYTLDGIYRPNYKVEVKDGEVVVAGTSFTDSYPSGTLTLPPLENASCMQTVYTETGNNQTLGCTANDGGLSSANILAILDDGCQFVGDTVTFTATYQLQSTASKRYDVGIYFATDGDPNNDGALTGTCTIGTLPYAPYPPWYDLDGGDLCGDISSSGPLNPEFTITALCIDNNNDGLLDLPYCTSYDNNTVGSCTNPLEAIPGTSSKCSCGTLGSIDITVPFSAEIEVIKNLVPSTDSGKFNLQIDGITEKADAVNGDSTGKISVTAGTSVLSGATHTVGEIAGAETNIVDYDSSISCVKRGTEIIVASGSGTGPLDVDVQKDDDIVCTITNTLHQGNIELQKDFVGTPENVTIKIGTTQDGSEVDSDTLTGDGTDGEHSVNTGTYYVSESLTNPSNYTSTLACYDDLNHDNSVLGDSVHNVDTSTGAVSIANGDDVICVFTNTRNQGTVVVKKVMVGGTDTFNFTGTPSGSIGVSGNTIQATVDTGQYTSTETTLSGWKLTDLTCSDSGNQNSFGDKNTGVATFNVESNETVTCTFTNTKYGSISGYKYESGNLTPLTGWVISLYEGTDLVATQSTTLSGYSFANLLPGIYSLFEKLQDGWTAISSPDPVDLGAGETSINNDFVNFKNISITACKKVDSDGDISTTRDQINRQGWAVKLLKDGQIFDTQNTGEDGCYIWADLGPGIYGVTEEALPSGWLPLTETTYSFGTAVSGQNQSFTFINFEKGHISGHKWNDLNGDGDWDKLDEPAIEGWTIYATYPDQSTHTRTTNSTGYYNFSDLGPGQYTIYENPPAGWTQTYPASNYEISMISNGNFENKDFGNQMRGTITIIKDSIPNNAQDFAFTSTQLGGFTLDDDSDPTESNTKVFLNKGYGTYTITESLVSGWKLTNLVCEGDSDAQVDVDNRTATLTINQPGESITCTFTNTKYGTIQGRKYEDINGDGNLDGGEPYLNNWTIHLFDSQMKHLGQMNTGDTGTTGQYKFENLMSGTYNICEDLKAGWKQTEPSTGQIRDGAYCRTETVEAGDVLSSKHFGNFELTYIQGRKFNDLNANGLDDNEPLLNDWTIRLYDSEWQQVGSDQLTHFISGNGDGRYRFENLFKGTYYICEVLQTGWTQTDPGSDEGIGNQSEASDEAPRCRVATINQSGTPVTGKIFGNVELSDIHGYKWNDINGNGTEDQDEPRLSGWKIFIDKNGDEIWNEGEQYMLTDSSQEHFGWYWFLDLIPGVYSICEEPQIGWSQTTAPTCHTVQLPYYLGENTCGQNMVNFTKDYVPTCNFGNQEDKFEVAIDKTNNKSSGASASDTVTYTLVVTNNGNRSIYNLDIKDFLPGGFTYVAGSTTGDTTNDPSVVGGTLTWNDVDNELEPNETFTIHYQAKIASDVSSGTYTNWATCGGDIRGEKETIQCNLDDSIVPVGIGFSYSGNLGGQVLGLSTELPATGNPTWILIVAVGALAAGIALNVIAKTKTKKSDNQEEMVKKEEEENERE